MPRNSVVSTVCGARLAAAARGVRRNRVWRAAFSGFLAHALALFLLVFATPGTAQVFEGSGAVSDADCCADGDCGDGCGHSCPASCTHYCCAHVYAVATAALVLPQAPLPREQVFVWSAERPCAPGYRAPPFRPPTV